MEQKKKSTESSSDFSQKIKDNVIMKPHEAIMDEKKKMLLVFVLSFSIGIFLFVAFSFLFYVYGTLNQILSIVALMLGFSIAFIVYTILIKKILGDG